MKIIIPIRNINVVNLSISKYLRNVNIAELLNINNNKTNIHATIKPIV